MLGKRREGMAFVLLLASAAAATAGMPASAPAPAPKGIRIDHTCVGWTGLSDKDIRAAAALRMLLRHASVGTGIEWGLDTMAGKRRNQEIGKPFPVGKFDRSRWVLEIRGNPGWKAKVDDLVKQATTRTHEFDVFMMKFCYIDALGNNKPDWEYYRAAMEKLEADFPNKRFVWWTIPLTRDGMPGTDAFNAQVRAYCIARGKILFDIADIECHDLQGKHLTNAAGHEVISAEYTREVHAGHLNPEGRVRVAAALWHLMARIASTMNASPK
ncbi:MAG: hypothetical protein N3D11_06510 [Candidatus Sumerlaeia bacterium]|nr:hypothetical protein [Candidatus Sumerlaeia bacterium]